VRLVALNLRGISGVDLGGPRVRNGVSENIVFTFKFMSFSLSPRYRLEQAPRAHISIEARAYLSPLASNTLLVPSRLAFLQRSASGTVCATRFATASAVVHVAA